MIRWVLGELGDWMSSRSLASDLESIPLVSDLESIPLVSGLDSIPLASGLDSILLVSGVESMLEPREKDEYNTYMMYSKVVQTGFYARVLIW